MDTSALFKIGYGLYVLSAKEGSKDNACIINTLMQVTSTPCMIEIAVNKMNYTCSIIQKTKKFNVSVLAEGCEFETFKCFGYQSGKEVDKFLNFSDTKRAKNGILYITKNTNSYISATVEKEIDLGSHILFIAKLDDAEVLSDEPTVTYDYYQKNIKPKKETAKTPTKGWRCRICGYIYEGEELPADYICPLCKHGAADFEKI